MAEVAEASYKTVESNLRQRSQNVMSVVGAELRTGKQTLNDVVALRPVAAIVDLVVGTVDNAGSFIKTQAEITRRWVH
jgi:hypothetical protein